MIDLKDTRSLWERMGHHCLIKPFDEIIREILQELCSEPETSSISTRSGKILTVRPRRSHTTYTLLAGIPLYLHSLNVAQRVIDVTPEKERGGLLLSILLLCALGHDVGKLLKYRTRDHNRNSHPLIGGAVVNKMIKDRLNSGTKQMIRETIELHHRPILLLERENKYLAVYVAQADRWARTQECLYGDRMYSSP